MIRKLVIVSAFLIFCGSRQIQDQSRVIERTFAITPSTSLQVNNRFGHVTVHEWERAEMKIRVTISADETNPKDLDKLLNSVHIDIRSEGNKVSYYTRLDDRLSGTVHIDYDIQMPSIAELMLINSFGNMNLDVIHSKSKVTLAHGEIQAAGFLKEVDLKLDFVTGEINSIDRGLMDLSYTNLEVEKIGSLELNSKFSDLDFGIVGDLDVKIKYGELKMDEVTSLKSDAHFSGFEVGLLKKSLRFQANYVSDFQIRMLDKDFESFEFSGQYTSMFLRLQERLSSNFDIRLSYGELNNLAPAVSYQTSIRESGKSEYSGAFNGGDPKKIIRIESSNGNVKIR